MKLPRVLDSFYKRCYKVPLVGKRILGPLLRWYWTTLTQIFNFISRSPSTSQRVEVSTYSSVIAGLRMQAESLERRVNHQELVIEGLKWEMDLRNKLESSAIDGIHNALKNLNTTT